MSSGESQPGWFQRVFGAGELQEKLLVAEQKTRDLELELSAAKSALEEQLSHVARAEARGAQIERELAEARAQADSLRSSQLEAGLVTEGLEAQLRERTDAVTRLERSAADNQRRWDAKGAELESLRKKARTLEQQSTQLADKSRELARELSVRDDELQNRAARIAALEEAGFILRAEVERSKGLGRELDSLKASRKALDATIARAEAEVLNAQARNAALNDAVRDWTTRTQELEHELAVLSEVAEARAESIEVMRRRMVELVAISARALDTAVGSGSHLALEVAAGAAVHDTFDAADAASDPATAVATHLAESGLVRTISLRAEGDGWTGQLRLPPAGVEANGGAAVARWVAAYATACLNQVTEKRCRVSRMWTEGGPDYEFAAVWCPDAARSRPSAATASVGAGSSLPSAIET